MKKLGVVVTLVVLCSLVVGLISCGGGETPTATQTPTSTPTGTATTTPTEVKPIKISYADYRAHKPGYFGQITEMGPWEAAVEAVSDGRLVLDVYDAGSLFSQKTAVVSLSQRVADCGFTSSSFIKEMPLAEVMRLPPLFNETTAIQNVMFNWFYVHEKLEPYWAEQNLTDLGELCLSPYLMMTAKKPVNGVDDLKGLTLGSTDAVIIPLMSEFGAIMQPVGNLDGFEALQKGIMDGGCWNWEGPALFGWWDAFDPGYYIDMGGIVRSGGGSNCMANLDFYNGLPADMRELFADITWRWASIWFAAEIDASNPAFQRAAAERGIEYIDWSDAEKAKFTEAKEAVYDQWIERMEKDYGYGDEATELVALYKKMGSEYVPAASVPTAPELAAPEDQAAVKAAWDAVFGPGTNWGMDYKAYPNQISRTELEGGAPEAW